MTDIVERLRKLPAYGYQEISVIKKEAADEIERLRAALSEAEIYFGSAWPDKVRAMSRAALNK